jgi:hypothetical protein
MSPSAPTTKRHACTHTHTHTHIRVLSFSQQDYVLTKGGNALRELGSCRGDCREQKTCEAQVDRFALVFIRATVCFDNKRDRRQRTSGEGYKLQHKHRQVQISKAGSCLITYSLQPNFPAACQQQRIACSLVPPKVTFNGTVRTNCTTT